MTKEIFSQVYDGETIADVQRDVMEAFDPQYNPTGKDIPVDEYGFHKGRFTVTIEWSDEEE